MKTDKELADELDAQERLAKRGWIKKSCTTCKGNGWLNAINMGCNIPCTTCEGKGHSWEIPAER